MKVWVVTKDEPEKCDNPLEYLVAICSNEQAVRQFHSKKHVQLCKIAGTLAGWENSDKELTRFYGHESIRFTVGDHSYIARSVDLTDELRQIMATNKT